MAHRIVRCSAAVEFSDAIWSASAIPSPTESRIHANTVYINTNTNIVPAKDNIHSVRQSVSPSACLPACLTARPRACV